MDVVLEDVVSGGHIFDVSFGTKILYIITYLEMYTQ